LKFLAFKWRGFERLGWLLDDEETVLAIDRESKGMPQTIMDVIKRGPYARHQIKKAEDSLDRLNINDLELLPPITPREIFSVDSNASTPAEENYLGLTTYPTISLRITRNHVTHGQAIEIPKLSKTLVSEGKLVVIMGKGGRYIGRQNALRHVFGYSIYNEGSVRDYQNHTPQLGLGKIFDASAAFGPAIVTADEFGDPNEQTIETRIDGEVVHSAPISNMRHKIEDVITYISSAIELAPGDMICLGVPTDTNAESTRFLQKDERMDISISRIGTLSNLIKDEPTEPRVAGCACC
jgi:2-keto-4-pentenoate hydratase/2-oxohepta-3-ene-1,7-dioic acid hydratase in catechol pathway